MVGCVRKGGVARLVDRLLVAGLIEARSRERLELLGAALADPKLSGFYCTLARAEAAHAEVFVALAREYGGAEAASTRLESLARTEAEIVAGLPLVPRIH